MNYCKITKNNIKNSYLLKFERSTISRAVSLGLFFVPMTLIPLQTVIISLLAVVGKANLPVAIAVSWINNPFTFVPITLFDYWIGSLILDEPNKSITLTTFNWELLSFKHWHELTIWFVEVGKNYFVGMTLLAIILGILGYILTNIIWRFAKL